MGFTKGYEDDRACWDCAEFSTRVGGLGRSAETGEAITVVGLADVGAGRTRGGGAVARLEGGRGRDRLGVGEFGERFFRSFVDAFFSRRCGLVGS